MSDIDNKKKKKQEDRKKRLEEYRKEMANCKCFHIVVAGPDGSPVEDVDTCDRNLMEMYRSGHVHGMASFFTTSAYIMCADKKAT